VFRKFTCEVRCTPCWHSLAVVELNAVETFPMLPL
jgi:hypothetical protein